ncbi:hypothetical protein JRQ81_005231, partial [Phrynocephalus forsythii]
PQRVHYHEVPCGTSGDKCEGVSTIAPNVRVRVITPGPPSHLSPCDTNGSHDTSYFLINAIWIEAGQELLRTKPITVRIEIWALCLLFRRCPTWWPPLSGRNQLRWHMDINRGPCFNLLVFITRHLLKTQPPWLFSKHSTSRHRIWRERTKVLIVGHSFIYWAAKYAAWSSRGQHLGLGGAAILEWRGYRGMLWNQVVPTALKLAQERPPDILLIHAGGNDLGHRPGKDLIKATIADLQQWYKRFPEVRMLWSTIVPRRAWGAGIDPQTINRARRGVNQEICKAVRQGRDSMIGHTGITHNRPELFRQGGVHLSDEGMQLLMDDLRRGLLAALKGPGGEAWQVVRGT